MSNEYSYQRLILIRCILQLVSRHRNNKKIPPPTIQTMVSGDHHKHVYGTGKNGPTVGGRHHPLNHPNSNYNVSSYGYDNYAIDDDMMMLEDDDLEDVDRLYDMDAVWADDKHKAAPSSSAKKVCIHEGVLFQRVCIRVSYLSIMNEQY